jgi:hypothetical protein
MTTTIEAPETEAEEPVATLNTADRCDACGSQAYVQVTLATGDLLFCGHHYSASEAKLSQLSPEVKDERWRLHAVAKLDVSA